MAVRMVCIGMAKIYKPNKGCTLKNRRKKMYEHTAAAVGRKKKKTIVKNVKKMQSISELRRWIQCTQMNKHNE